MPRVEYLELRFDAGIVIAAANPRIVSGALTLA